MSISWDWMQAYAFPLLCLIHKVLLKLQTSRTRLLLIAPRWPRRPCFPLLLNLLREVPRSLPESPHLLSQTKGRVFHSNIRSLDLTAWSLPSLTSWREALRKTLPIWQQQGDDPAPSTYSSRLTNYHQWCADTQIVPYTATVNQITDFFRHLFDQGKQWQSTWRSRTGFR